MKYKFNYKAFAAVAMMIFASSCNDSIEREASPVASADNMGLYFPSSNITTASLPLEGGEFELTISRDADATAAATFDINSFVSGGMADCFAIPSTVSFEANEQTTTLTVLVEDLEAFTPTTVSFSFDTDATNPYLDIEDGYQACNVIVECHDYALAYSGIYYSGFFSYLYDQTISWEQDLKYSETLDKYLFESLYETGYNIYFTIDEDNLIVVEDTQSISDIGYGPTYVYSMTDDYASYSYYNSADGIFNFALYWYDADGPWGGFIATFTITDTY